MLLFDVNIYVYAHREDSARHSEMRALLENALSGPEPVGYSPLVLSGFVRVATHPKVFAVPTSLEVALEFCRIVMDLPGSLPIVPAGSHWSIFKHLLLATSARGNLVPDAWFAALAIESGCTWVTTDRDYARFPGLDVQFPSGHSE